MSERSLFRLVHDVARKNAALACARAPQGWVVEIREPTRSDAQNALLHAALSDIAKQVEWHGKRFDVLTWKRLCTASWLREIGESPELIPALDGKGFDVIFERTSKMTVPQMTSLIEWCLAFGAENGVAFKDQPKADTEGEGIYAR